MGPAPAGEVGLGDDGDLRLGHACSRGAAARRRCTRRAAVRSVSAAGHREVEPAVAAAGWPGAGPSRRRRRRRRRGTCRRAGRAGGWRGPRRRRRPGPSRWRRPSASRATRESLLIVHTAWPAAEQAVGLGVQAGERARRRRGPRCWRAPWRGRPPRRAGRWPGRACGAARPAPPWRVAGSTSVSSVVAVDQPRQPALHAVEQRALGEALPLLAAPRLARPRARRRGRARRRSGISSRAGKIGRLVEVVRAALVVDRELGEPVDLVAPQVDADRRVGGATGRCRRWRRAGRPRRGARPAPRGGSRRGRAAASSSSGSRIAPLAHVRPARRRSASGPRCCSSARTPATTIARAAARACAGATAPRAGGPWSPRWG